MNGRSPPPPAAANRRASSTIASRFAAPCSPSGRVSANSTSRVRSTTRRTSLGERERGVRIRCRSRSSASAVVDRPRSAPRSWSGRTARRPRRAWQHELLVVDRERARAQRADEREPVGRVVDRGQHPDQVADLVALEEVARALVPVRDPGVGERVLVVLDPGAGGHQDRHVAPPARPPAIVVAAVADLPALARARCAAARRSPAPPPCARSSALPSTAPSSDERPAAARAGRASGRRARARRCRAARPALR